MTLFKKKYPVFFLSILLMVLSSCKDEMNLFGSRVEDADGELKIKVSMYLPELMSLPTRGVLDNVNDSPDKDYLSNLNFYIFVFEDNGNPHANYLRQLVYANDIVEPPTVEEDDTHTVDAEGNKISTNWLVKFKVRFDGTAENAILHIVATKDTSFEEQLAYVPDRSEFGIFAGAQGLFTTDGEAYWKRVELNLAINADSKEAVESKLQHLKMVRNFARITVNKDITENPYGLVIDGFVIANAVDKGYVAAYNENLGTSGEAGFVDFEDANGLMRTYRDLHNTLKYIPARHPLSGRQNADDDLAWTSAFEQQGGGNMNPKYLFERDVQDDHKTFVILKCHYSSAPSVYKYIKLDIGTNDKNIPGSQYPGYGVFESMDVIRNISYDFTIEKVGANNLGHDNVDAALGSPPSNNISVSVETRPVTTINDGIDEMKVNKTTWVIIDDEETGNPIPASAEMIWSYEENFQNDITKKFVSELVNWNYPGYNFSFENGKDPNGVIASWDGDNGLTNQKVTPVIGQAADYPTNQKGFKLYFNKPDDVTRQKTIRLYKPDGLSRDITFILRKKWEFVNRIPNIRTFNVEVYSGAYSYKDKTMPYESLDEMREKITPGYVSGHYGADLTVMFELPGDLPEAIFPLDFTIGFDRQNVENAFVGNAVATWGPSLWADEGDMPRIQFVKTVTWAEYVDHKVVCARFLTTTDVDIDGDDLMADEDGFVVSPNRVRVRNEYFKLGETNFERSKKDPTTNQWYWNFSYPEWANFFAQYTDCNLDPTGWPDTSGNTEANPHVVKGLNFAGYVKGQKDDYTNVSGSFMQPKADLSGNSRSAENPEFQFNVNQSFENGATAKMVIEATPNRDRNYLGATYRYEFWYRTVWVKIITKNHPEGYDEYVKSQNCDGREGTKEGTLNRYRLEMRTLTYEFEIEPGDEIEKVLIWSVKREGSQPSGLGTYYYRDGETRYYSIEFTLAPK